jgi:hypothetical protein
MEKRDQEELETIDLEKMNEVSGGCAKCGDATHAAGAQNLNGLKSSSVGGNTPRPVG